MTFDVQAIRAEFPVFTRQINGRPLIYLDSAASAQKPISVIEKYTQASTYHYANVHRGLYTLANEATEAYEGARKRVASFLGATSPETIIFTKNATEAINLVASSFVAPQVGEGDVIALSLLEHHSNIIPYHFLRERQGIRLEWMDPDETGQLSMDTVRRVLDTNPKFLAITMMSNALGTLTPIQSILDEAHAREIPTLVDASQAAVHLDIDVEMLSCDFLVCTGHKLYGPSGIGILYGRSDHLENMRPFLGGGEMIDQVSKSEASYNNHPHKFEAGTPPICEAAALTTALDFIDRIGKRAVRAHEADLLDYSTDQALAVEGLRIIGTANNKAAILSLHHPKAHAHDIATLLDQQGIAVRAGTHCAMPLLQHFGISSTVRMSFGVYNTRDDVDAFFIGLEKALRLLT